MFSNKSAGPSKSIFLFVIAPISSSQSTSALICFASPISSNFFIHSRKSLKAIKPPFPDNFFCKYISSFACTMFYKDRDLISSFWTSQLSIIQVGSNPARVNAMIAGQVQGALLNSDTHAPQARKLGLRTLASLPDLGIEFMQSCLVTTRSYVRTHSHLVRSYIKALVEAIAWLKDERNRSEGQKIMGDFLRNQDTELMENMYESLVKKVFQPAPYPTVGAVQNMLDHLALTNPKARQAKAEDFIDNRFIREIGRASCRERV